MPFVLHELTDLNPSDWVTILVDSWTGSLILSTVRRIGEDDKLQESKNRKE